MFWLLIQFPYDQGSPGNTECSIFLHVAYHIS